jgi:hypothetical protein
LAPVAHSMPSSRPPMPLKSDPMRSAVIVRHYTQGVSRSSRARSEEQDRAAHAATPILDVSKGPDARVGSQIDPG